MVLSSPSADYIEIITLKTVKKMLGINPMGLITPRAYSLEVVSLQTVFYVRG